MPSKRARRIARARRLHGARIVRQQRSLKVTYGGNVYRYTINFGDSWKLIRKTLLENLDGLRFIDFAVYMRASTGRLLPIDNHDDFHRALKTWGQPPNTIHLFITDHITGDVDAASDEHDPEMALAIALSLSECSHAHPASADVTPAGGDVAVTAGAGIDAEKTPDDDDDDDDDVVDTVVAVVDGGVMAAVSASVDTAAGSAAAAAAAASAASARHTPPRVRVPKPAKTAVTTTTQTAAPDAPVQRAVTAILAQANADAAALVEAARAEAAALRARTEEEMRAIRAAHEAEMRDEAAQSRAALRAQIDELTTRAAALSERSAELAAKRAAVADAERAVGVLRNDIAVREASLEARSRALEADETARADAFAQRVAHFEEMVRVDREQHTERYAEVEEMRQFVMAARAEQEAAAAAVASREEAVASREEAVASREEAVAAHEEAVASREEAVACREETVASREEAVAACEGKAETQADADMSRCPFVSTIRTTAQIGSTEAMCALLDRYTAALGPSYVGYDEGAFGDAGEELEGEAVTTPTSDDGGFEFVVVPQQ